MKKTNKRKYLNLGGTVPEHLQVKTYTADTTAYAEGTTPITTDNEAPSTKEGVAKTVEDQKKKGDLLGKFGSVAAAAAGPYAPLVGLGVGLISTLTATDPNKYKPAMKNTNPHGLKAGGNAPAVTPYGKDERLSSSTFKVKYSGNKSDDKNYGHVNLDKNETVTADMVFSDSIINPSSGRTFAKDNERIQKTVGKVEKKIDVGAGDRAAMNTYKMLMNQSKALFDTQEELKAHIMKPANSLNMQDGGKIKDPPEIGRIRKVREQLLNQAANERDPVRRKSLMTQANEQGMLIQSYELKQKPSAPKEKSLVRQRSEARALEGALKKEQRQKNSKENISKEIARLEQENKELEPRKSKDASANNAFHKNRARINELKEHPSINPKTAELIRKMNTDEYRHTSEFNRGKIRRAYEKYHDSDDPTTQTSSTEPVTSFRPSSPPQYFPGRTANTPNQEQQAPVETNPQTAATAAAQTPARAGTPRAAGAAKTAGTPKAKASAEDIGYDEFYAYLDSLPGGAAKYLPKHGKDRKWGAEHQAAVEASGYRKQRVPDKIMKFTSDVEPIKRTPPGLTAEDIKKTHDNLLKGDEKKEAGTNFFKDLLGKTTFGDGLQMAAIAQRAKMVREGYQKYTPEQIAMRQIDSTPFEQSMNSQFRANVNSMNRGSYNLNQAAQQNAYANLYGSTSDMLSSVANQNKQLALGIDQTNVQLRAQGRDITERRQAMWNQSRMALADSVANFGKAINRKKEAYDVLPLFAEMFPDAFEHSQMATKYKIKQEQKPAGGKYGGKIKKKYGNSIR